MADPVTLAIVAAGAGGLSQGGMSFMQAKQAQEYQDARLSAERKAVKTQNVQLSAQAQLERLKSHNEANMIRSRIRVAAGESGIGYGGTYEALQRQADYDELLNREIIDQNFVNALASSNSRLSVGEPMMNPLLAAFIGGLGGAQSGLSIGQSINKIGAST